MINLRRAWMGLVWKIRLGVAVNAPIWTRRMRRLVRPLPSNNLAPLVVRCALLTGIVYLAFYYYAEALKLSAETKFKLAEAQNTEFEADALRTQINGQQAATAAALADMEKLSAEAQTADAAAEAQGQRIGDLTMREASLRAEIDAATNEGRKLEAEANAQMQKINGAPLLVAKMKQTVEAQETEMEQRLWQEHLEVEGMKRGDWRTYGLGPMLGGRQWKEDGITRFPFAQIFSELHK